MATGSELAAAYVTLSVKMPGVQKDIYKTVGGVDMTGAGQQVGAKFADGMKESVKVAGVAIAAVLGTAIVKGFGRLKAIETAEAKMKGLGFTGQQVTAAMDAALGSVKGTAFGLGEAATVAGQMMAANVKPGKELEAVLSTVANNASAAGVGMDEMGSIFAKAATQANGVQNDVIGQLADKGIPIYQKLGEQMGVTAGEVFKMASEGKVSFEMFQSAATAAAGTVAEELGNTTTGSFDNMMAALGRFGAKLLQDIFPLIGPLFKDITAWLDESLVHIEPVVDAFGTWLKEAIDNVGAAFEWVKKNIDWIAPLAVTVGTAVAAVWLWNTATKAWLAGQALVKGVQAAYIAATYGQVGATYAAGGAQRFLNVVMNANPIMLIVTAIAALVAGLIYFFTQTETGKAIWAEFTRFLGEAWANIAGFFQGVWENVLKPIFDGIATVVTWLWVNILQPIFNGFQVAFAILGGILAGIWEAIIKPIFDALGAVFVWIYNTIIVPIIDGIKLYIQAWAAIFTWLWETILKPVFDAIGVIFTWLYENVIKPIVDGIKLAIQGAGIVFTWLYENAIKPAMDAVGAVFSWLYNTIIKPIWDGISSVIKGVWENGIKPVIDTLVKVIQSDPKKAFEAARDAIGDAWAGIQELAKKPVRFVVETVINGLIDTINGIPGVNIPKVKLPKGFSDGGYTGNMAANAVAGVVHGNEHVIKAPSRKAIEARHPGLLDHMNQYGSIPGYKKGGMVHPMPGAGVTTEFMGYPGHTGIDLAKPQGTAIQAAAAGVVTDAGWKGMGGNMVYIDHGAGLSTRYAHMLSNIAVKVGQTVKAGQRVGSEGSTGNSTGPHLHYEVLENGRFVNPRSYLDGAGSINPLSGIIDGLLDWATGKFKGAFPDGSMFIDAAGGLMKQGVTDVSKWAMDLLSIGGTTPTLYDNGGWLDPGTHLVQNKSGRPEPILTGSQWDAMTRGGEGDRPVYVQNPFTGEYLLAKVDERADGRIDEALSPVSPGSVMDRLGVR